jgi:hypothetical protein
MAEPELIPGPPDFIGVGTQRSGTTWWQRLLRDHPAIRLPRNKKKEQHFFDKFGRRPMTPEDITRYHDLFPRAPGELSGEWTPRYMRDIWGPRVLSQAAPDAKLLVMFRDPVERYRSGVLHTSAREPGRVTTLLSTDAVDRGKYAQQLRRLYDYFAPDQVLVMQYEQCVQDPMLHYRRTLEFIGAPSVDHVPEDLTRTRGTATKSRREPIWDDLRSALVRELEDDVEELRELFPELDVALWKNFEHLADGGRPAPQTSRPLTRTPAGGPPDYVGVGTADAGCAWWHKLLLEHPAVKRPAAGRGLEFFATFCTRAMTDDDVAAYHGHFSRGDQEVIGEWTPDYVHQAWTPMLLQRAAPDAKLLVILTNPLHRYAATVAERRRTGDRDSRPSLAESLARGRYTEQLRGLLDYYTRDQVLVLQFERCVKDPAAEYERTLRFLGVDPGFRPEPLRTSPFQRARRILGGAEGPELGAPTRRRAELWPDIAIPLQKALEADVVELLELVPDLDLSLWPEFAHLGDTEPDTPARRPISV